MNERPNTTRRPWPVNPSQYPLDGPRTGPVYCPPPDAYTPPKDRPWLAFALWVAVGALAAMVWPPAFAIVLILVAFGGE